MGDNYHVNVKVLLFAKARELGGIKESELKVLSSISYTSLLDFVVKQFSLDPIKGNIILAINQEYSSADSVLCLKDGDEIAVIPPLSGG